MATDDPEHRDQTARRWAERTPVREWSPDQCGRCAFWLPLSGRWGFDWGACSNEASANDKQVTLETDRCPAFKDAGDRWTRTPSRASASRPAS